VAFGPDGRRLVSSGQDETIRLWDVASGHELLALKGHSGRVRSVVFSGDGRKIASVGDDGTAIVRDASPPAPPAVEDPRPAQP
jgi:WD40 repeat protein